MEPIEIAAKNGYYGSLVPMVRDAFIFADLVRIDCQGLERSDYKRIGCKLRDLVPYIPVAFDKEHIVVWRGRDYKPPEDGCFATDQESADDLNMISAAEEHESDVDDNGSQPC